MGASILNKQPSIKSLQRKIKELETKYEELRASVGYEELEAWKPDSRIERQYGWIYAWLYPLQSYFNSNGETSPEVRNKALAITHAIICQLVIAGKYGVRIPVEPREIDDNDYISKQVKYFEYDYEPCQICGEDRITHECHIIPRSEGGPNHRDNFVILCPLHHHLFDNHRLNRNEWKIILKAIDQKMESANMYAKEVRQCQLELFWNNPSRKYPGK